MAVNFLVSNLISSNAMLTATRQAPARLTGVTKSQQGAALFLRGGVYTGAIDRLYVIEILSVAISGVFSPATTFRWSDDGGITWGADQSIPTSGGVYVLSFGVEVAWIATVGVNEFVVDDRWTFQALRPYGVAYLLDGDRTSEFRTDGLATSDIAVIAIDFGTPQIPTAAVLHDHNLVPTSTVILQASAVADFSVLLLSVTIPWQAGAIVAMAPTHWTALSARYWRWAMIAASGQSDIRVSEMYLGTRTVMSLAFRLGFSEDQVELASLSRDVLARGSGPATLVPRVFEIEFGQLRDGSGQDRAKLEQVWAAANHLQSRTRRPFWFIPHDADLARTYLMHWEGDFTLDNRSDALAGTAGALYSSAIRLTEVVRAA